MSVAVRRNLILAWLAVLSVVLGFTVRWHAAAEHRVTEFDEINAHRINIIEPDGKPRVIIPDRARMAGVYWEGKEYQDANRDEGGLLFFDDEGREAGGLSFSNRREGDSMAAETSLLFDQYHQDQTVGLIYREENGYRTAGMRVWDRPNQSLLPALELSDRLAKATTEQSRATIEAERQSLVQSWGGHPVTERLFAGKVAKRIAER